MPTGTLGNPTKKKIRPSSASANLQTHPDFKSGLYDNTRPTTANHAGLHSRPKTQASGPRFWSKGRDDVEAKPQRRLTVGAVDGIGSRRPGLGKRMHTSVQPVGSLLKGKVSCRSITKFNIISLHTNKDFHQIFDTPYSASE